MQPPWLDESWKEKPCLVTGTSRMSLYVWWKSCGPVPKGLEVCHHCHNPLCRELTHLYLDTRRGNANHPESRRRLSEAKKGQGVGRKFSLEHRAKIGLGHKGKPKPDWLKQRMSEGQKRAWQRRRHGSSDGASTAGAAQETEDHSG